MVAAFFSFFFFFCYWYLKVGIDFRETINEILVNLGMLLPNQGWEKLWKKYFLIQISITSLSFGLLTWNKKEMFGNLMLFSIAKVSVSKSLKFLSYWPEHWSGKKNNFFSALFVKIRNVRVRVHQNNQDQMILHQKVFALSE